MDWRILSAGNPRKQAYSFCKWLQVEHSSWDTSVFVPEFGFRRVLNGFGRFSRAAPFPVCIKECLNNFINQDCLYSLRPLQYLDRNCVERGKSRWGRYLIGKRCPGCPSLYQAAQACRLSTSKSKRARRFAWLLDSWWAIQDLNL